MDAISNGIEPRTQASAGCISPTASDVDELRELLRNHVAGRRLAELASCGSEMGALGILKTTLWFLLHQASGDVDLALEDAFGGIDGMTAYPQLVVELDGCEYTPVAMNAAGRLALLFDMWCSGRVSYPLSRMVIEDCGASWPHLVSLATDGGPVRRLATK